jgi:hypothetical protein
MKRVSVALLALGLFCSLAAAQAAEEPRILSCNVDFKVKNKLTTFRTENQGWLLPVDKGSVNLKSLGQVKIKLSKVLVKDEPQFRLQILDGKSRDEITVGFHGFEYSVPVSIHEDDGEDGVDYDLLKISCDSGYAVG